jgi:hypothetical protein
MTTNSESSPAQRSAPALISDRVLYGIYAVATAVSISLWFVAIRSPLWLDETHSFYVIKSGFFQIKSRVGWPIVPVYPYILWLFAKILGTSEIALRIPSALAMLGAVYILYRAALDLFSSSTTDRDVAIITAVVFSLHPVVIFAAIDARPYAFAALAMNAAILALVRLRHNDSNWAAALFGVLSASIAYFQFVFVILLPALAIGFIAIKAGDRKAFWRQAGVAFAAFVLGFVPVFPLLNLMFNTRGTHVFAGPPSLLDLAATLAADALGFVLIGVLLIALAKRQLDLRIRSDAWRIALCASLGLIPILILFFVSRDTSMHLFVGRYRLVGVPGIALCWGLIVSRINLRPLRLMFCVAVVATAASLYLIDPASQLHGYTWKYALDIAEKNASPDGAPILICSDFHEADDLPMPVGESVKDNGLFAPLTYYPLSVPVVGLPRALNDEAIRVASSFLQQATKHRERFLVVAFIPSYETLNWIVAQTSATYDAKQVGISNGIKVVAFTPRPQPSETVHTR